MTATALILGMLAAFITGAYVTYKAMSKQSPVPKISSIMDGVIDDLPDPVSPYAESKKSK